MQVKEGSSSDLFYVGIKEQILIKDFYSGVGSQGKAIHGSHIIR